MAGFTYTPAQERALQLISGKQKNIMLIIGLFHPVVIKAEYYWGTKCWWIFLVLGVLGIIGALLVESILISSLLGVFAFSSFWTIKEVFDQRKRVLKGWFPMNPKRKHEYE